MTVCQLDTNISYPMSAKLQLGRQTCSNASLRLYVNVRIHSEQVTEEQIVIGFYILLNLVHDEHCHRIHFNCWLQEERQMVRIIWMGWSTWCRSVLVTNVRTPIPIIYRTSVEITIHSKLGFQKRIYDSALHCTPQSSHLEYLPFTGSSSLYCIQVSQQSGLN